MAFNLQKVLKALLFSSSQPLSVKDVQAVFARFHDQAVLPVVNEGETESAATAETGGEEKLEAGSQMPEATAGSVEATEVAVVSPEEKDAELYQDVPSLITATQIREAMAAIGEELRVANDIYLLIEGPTGFRIVTHPRFARWIRIQRDEPAPVKLTQSALETLAIVAYRQPVTRTELEAIRGVSAEAGLNKLMERELVYITGRADLPGRPLQYGTTDKFLDFVGVKSLVELPASDVLSPRQIDEWMKNAINPKTPTDAEMGLPLEEGEGDSPNLEAVSVEHHDHSQDAMSESAEESVESSVETVVSEAASEDASDADEAAAADESEEKPV
ncbi:SMC-Scp complex subunit ScpB [Nibricoccus aquaticus]|uniref:SMC-Scp complex subunit ScpB n=1 Tax=Nibricoccus aquaticus TaxID=2576891 RepID=A0A290QBN5_9BACT|nr:SMC-Scp complex subunit ScpB [Nibricoccus aquaticus]ATC65934.1 SMC-Scp complex subunit ScpB [Nibricoccus aquaticus]